MLQRRCPSPPPRPRRHDRSLPPRIRPRRSRTALRRPPAPRSPALRACRSGLRDPLADPGRVHPATACRPRHPWRGADRHRQDRRLRAADAGQARPRRHPPAGAGAHPHARARDPGRRGLRQVRPPPEELPRAADLRRPEHGGAAAPALARRPGDRRHPGPGHGPPRAREPQARRAQGDRARRGRRDAAHGLHRRRRVDPRAHPGRAPDRAVLGHHAERDPRRRPPPPAQPAGNQDPRRHLDRGQDQPALLAGARGGQARRAHPHPRRRGELRRRDRVRAHQDRHRGTRRQARRARLRRRRAQRRHEPGPARARDRAAQERRARHRDRHRRGRARHRRAARLARDQLRHPLRHRGLCAPHRPHRPRRARGGGDPVRGAARDAHAQDDRARHPPADHPDRAAEQRGGHQPARGPVQAPGRRDHRGRRTRLLHGRGQRPDRGERARDPRSRRCAGAARPARAPAAGRAVRPRLGHRHHDAERRPRAARRALHHRRRARAHAAPQPRRDPRPPALLLRRRAGALPHRGRPRPRRQPQGDRRRDRQRGRHRGQVHRPDPPLRRILHGRAARQAARGPPRHAQAHPRSPDALVDPRAERGRGGLGARTPSPGAARRRRRLPVAGRRPTPA